MGIHPSDMSFQLVNDPEIPVNTGDQADDGRSQASAQEETLLDVKGLKCPMPLLKAKKALNALEPGALLRVVATDPGSERDFETFSAQSGHALLEFERQQDEFIYLLRKKDA
jgi:TusA-related sulfurtransferase